MIDEKHKFDGNLPSKTWVYRFLQRHPVLSGRVAENLGLQRAYITEKTMRNWYDNLKNYLHNEHNIVAEEFLSPENGNRIFNLDESGFPLQGTAAKLKIIAERGSKNIYKLSSDSKEQITVLVCADAAGEPSKPLVIYPGVRPPKFNFSGVDESSYDVSFTPNG